MTRTITSSHSPCVALAALARRVATSSENSRPTAHMPAMVAAVQAAGMSRCMSLKRSRTKTLQAYLRPDSADLGATALTRTLATVAQTAPPPGASDSRNLNRDGDVRHRGAHVRVFGLDGPSWHTGCKPAWNREGRIRPHGSMLSGRCTGSTR